MVKVTSRKYEGDDRYSWAIFRSDFPHFPVYSGLTKREIPYYKKQVENKIAEENLAKLARPIKEEHDTSTT